MSAVPQRQLLGSLERPASMDAWDELIGFIQAQVEQALPDSRKSYGVLLASEELLSNMVRVAEESSATPTPVDIRLRAWLVGEGGTTFELEISDNGTPFDPQFERIADTMPDIPIEERPIGGLGLYLVKSSVDQASYSYQDGRNTYHLSARKE